MSYPHPFDFVRTQVGLGMTFISVAQTAHCVGSARRRGAAKARAEEAYRTAIAMHGAAFLTTTDFEILQHRLETLRHAIDALALTLVEA